ncbi:hypothetical protein PT2222_180019 [Paraburkholderia tropica]
MDTITIIFELGFKSLNGVSCSFWLTYYTPYMLVIHNTAELIPNILK